MEPSSVHAMQQLYARIADAYADRYFDDLSDAAVVDDLIACLPDAAAVLDVGSGPGTYSRYMGQRGLAVTGVDLSPEMIQIAKERVPDVDFRRMDMRNLDFPARSFDGVLCAYSLIHIPTTDVPDVLAGFHRLLRPGGCLLVIGQEGNPDHVEDDPLVPGEQVFVNFFTEARLRRLVEEAGFMVRRSAAAGTLDAESMSMNVISALAVKGAES